MIEMHSLSLVGKSKKMYDFTVHPWGDTLEKVGAIYIVTQCKQDEEGESDFKDAGLYLGMSESIGEEDLEGHPKGGCFKAYGGNAIGYLSEADADARQEIYDDLIDEYSFPCNKPGAPGT